MAETEWLTDEAELERYAQAVAAFLAGDLDEERFMAMRLQQGVYGQRQAGMHMVRIKLPGGRLDPQRLRGIARTAERYAKTGHAHLSTRQDIQLHYVPTRDTPAALRLLASVGLTTREACGNTVRNITACPLAGVCPREHTDISVHLNATVRHFLRHPLTQHLPRKFKISFSGCDADCAQGLMHDVGVVATRHEGRSGFRVMAGGGLGAKPHAAITVEPFIEEHELLPTIEALIALHYHFSDRKRRARSRLKFLVDRFGADGFIEKYREELAHARAAARPDEAPRGQWREGESGPACGAGAPRRLFPQRQRGLFVVPIAVPLGEVTPARLHGLADLMEREGLVDARTTQDQNLMLVGVPAGRVAAVTAAVEGLGLALPQSGSDVVACPGTDTCRLGITSSMQLGALLAAGTADLRIRISGCHNSCAQPDTADIGLYGQGKRIHGRLVPHYVLQLGGSGLAGGALAFDGPEVPSARVPRAVRRIQEEYLNHREPGEEFFAWARRNGPDYFKTLLADLCAIGEAELAFIARDHGQSAAFKVVPLGGGECGGAAQEQVAAYLGEAAYERDCRNAFAAERRYPEALECLEAILRLTGLALVQAIDDAAAQSGLPGVTETLRRAAPQWQDWATELGRLGERVDVLADLELPDEGLYQALAADVDAWTRRVAQACQARDPRLNLGEAIRNLGPAPGSHRPRPAAAG